MCHKRLGPKLATKQRVGLAAAVLSLVLSAGVERRAFDVEGTIAYFDPTESGPGPEAAIQVGVWPLEFTSIRVGAGYAGEISLDALDLFAARPRVRRKKYIEFGLRQLFVIRDLERARLSALAEASLGFAAIDRRVGPCEPDPPNLDGFSLGIPACQVEQFSDRRVSGRLGVSLDDGLFSVIPYLELSRVRDIFFVGIGASVSWGM